MASKIEPIKSWRVPEPITCVGPPLEKILVSRGISFFFSFFGPKKLILWDNVRLWNNSSINRIDILLDNNIVLQTLKIAVPLEQFFRNERKVEAYEAILIIIILIITEESLYDLIHTRNDVDFL